MANYSPLNSMRNHPIPPATDPFQYRAIGIVRGVYLPEDEEKFNRGKLILSDGEEIDSVVLGRVITLMKRHLSIKNPHLWVVYPRCREIGNLHLQISGIWEPSTLLRTDSGTEIKDNSDKFSNKDSLDNLPEGDDYFSIRGEVIFIKPESNQLIIKVRQKIRPNGNRPIPFKLNLEGQLPLDCLRKFVNIKARRKLQSILVEDFEVIGPIQTRGGKKGNNARISINKTNGY